MTSVAAVIEWARRQRLIRHPRLPEMVALESRSKLPQSLSPRCVYLIGTPAKWAVFRCPCGRGHEISLNLAHTGHKRWAVTVDDQHACSIDPSVDVQGPQRCHFWLRSGRVHWYRSL